jgi:hypothetical protein
VSSFFINSESGDHGEESGCGGANREARECKPNKQNRNPGVETVVTQSRRTTPYRRGLPPLIACIAGAYQLRSALAGREGAPARHCLFRNNKGLGASGNAFFLGKMLPDGVFKKHPLLSPPFFPAAKAAARSPSPSNASNCQCTAGLINPGNTARPPSEQRAVRRIVSLFPQGPPGSCPASPPR